MPLHGFGPRALTRGNDKMTYTLTEKSWGQLEWARGWMSCMLFPPFTPLHIHSPFHFLKPKRSECLLYKDEQKSRIVDLLYPAEEVRFYSLQIGNRFSQSWQELNESRLQAINSQEKNAIVDTLCTHCQHLPSDQRNNFHPSFTAGRPCHYFGAEQLVLGKAVPMSKNTHLLRILSVQKISKILFLLSAHFYWFNR